MANTTGPDAVQSVTDLYVAVESLKSRAAEAYAVFEDSGDLNFLTSELGYIRDRAGTIQNVTIAWADALREQL